MDLSQFIAEYFVNPIENPAQYAPYNVVNTLVFAAVALAAAYLILRQLQKWGVKIDWPFAAAVMPFAALGAIVRVLSDAEFLPRKVEVAGAALYPFITPGVYIVVFIAFAVVLALSARFSRNWQATTMKAGVALSAIALLPLLPLIREWTAIAVVAAMTVAAIAAYWAASKTGLFAQTNFGWLVALGQGLDGAATYTGVSLFGYSEQHLLANAVFGVGTPAAFFALKAAFAIAVAYAAGKERDGDEKNYVMLLIAVMGFAPGLRDILRVAAGV